jgi:hypothetical protein
METLYEKASLILNPGVYDTSKVYATKPFDGSGDLTFTRSNDTATRVASNGLIERVRTNLALQSQTFDNASWVKAFATITANATTAPDGTLTADKLIANIGYDPVSATGNLRQTNIVATNTHTISLYAKAAEFTSIRFRENFIVGAFLTIDLTNGSITGAGSQYINPTATAVGDGWYRISFVTPATADLDKYSIRVANTGDGTSGVFIWGFQYEVSDFGPTDYIATTTAAVSVGPVANLPRLDYSGGATCPKLLLEPQRTNLFPYSNYFGTDWVLTAATITTNATTSPEGVDNASLYTSSNATNAITDTITAANGTYTLSAFFKRDATDNVRMNFSDGVTGEIRYVFNLTDETSTLTKSGGTISNYSADFENYGNGWYRLYITATKNSGTAIAAYFETDNETGSFYLYGAQLEAGSHITSLIPSYGAAVTRGADAASKTGISSLIGSAAGTIYVEFSALANDLSERRIALSDGTTGNVARVGYTNASNRILAVLL